MRPFLRLVARFGRDESGVFAIMFGLMAVVLIAMGGAVVDYVRLEQTRNRAQIALDAAALALEKDAFRTGVTNSWLIEKAQALLVDRISDPDVTAEVTLARTDAALGSLYFEATMSMPTLFVGLVGVHDLGAGIVSEVTRGSMDIEVAVAVDLTGSMNDPIATSDEGTAQQSKVAALKTALGQLINIVVQDEQTPTYSKMALVPYSMAVNVGSTYAASIRGASKAPTAITAIGWASGAGKVVTGATKKNPVVITSVNHGFVTGDTVYINNVSGMTQLNNKIFTVTKVDADSYELKGINGGNYGSYVKSTGTATKCLVATCELVVTSSAHGLASNSQAYIYGINGMPSLNNNSATSGNNLAWTIGAATTNTFVLPNTAKTNGINYGTYSSGGSVACVLSGCDYYLFSNPYGKQRRFPISTCITERTTNAYTDASPSTALLGRNYPGSGNPCISNTVLPLTSNKTILHDVAQKLTAGGSTAGHTGAAWAWYMVSPNFNGPWPQDSQPAGPGKVNIIKAVVLMTDGEFNSSYCNGVISQSSTSGSGDTNDQINCDAPNGSSYSQTQSQCNAMKRAGIIVYTVGFAIVNSQSAINLMANCATDASHAYQANSGQELSDVFSEIGRKLAALRVTR
ncbi:pilus assembly protein TadG-related protein [Devosia neptuniae]|uniref:Pilus assembly protein TadG-related protein n=1 Tax=Devosia neptuniae TaxID=191302 RepID=A0ABY6CFF4_9HYPH|nr:ubiquitin-activating E1 FCCH domain-containing protein [Devosia neptuniae]UXN70538.1 pilus assembly protein TadG-related protein [Devosia neptuniae]